MPDELTRPDALPVAVGSLAQAAQAADLAASAGALQRYRAGLSAQTRRAQDADLARWSRYLAAVGLAGADCAWAEHPECWSGVTWGLVEGFVRWQYAEGYSAATVARALSTVRRYAAQAARAGALPSEALRLIETVEAPAPRSRAARNVDATRPTTRRPNAKKAAPTTITRQQARALKAQPDTPEGRRDALLMCLLLDHGLRVSEVADLKVSDLDLAAGLLRFYRRKVHKHQTHALSPDTRRAARRYFDAGDAPPAGPLLVAYAHKHAPRAGMTTQAIAARVHALGARIGINARPHDCRHYWATEAARRGIDPLRLQEAGGWASLTMPRRYVAAAEISNAGMVEAEE
jgi:integrase